MDFVLTIEKMGTGEEQHPEQAPVRRRCICVGEIKAPQKLIRADGVPLDLVELWNRSASTDDSPVHRTVRAVISQLFTYMQLWKLSYGFLSCWFWTWLVYCPPKGRTQLFISTPLPASRCHAPPHGPAATVIGALAWLQQQALDGRDVAVDEPPAPATSSPGPTRGEAEDDAGPEPEESTESKSSRWVEALVCFVLCRCVVCRTSLQTFDRAAVPSQEGSKPMSCQTAKAAAAAEGWQAAAEVQCCARTANGQQDMHGQR